MPVDSTTAYQSAARASTRHGRGRRARLAKTWSAANTAERLSRAARATWRRGLPAHPLERLEDDGLLIVVYRASYGDGLAASLR